MMTVNILWKDNLFKESEKDLKLGNPGLYADFKPEAL